MRFLPLSRKNYYMTNFCAYGGLLACTGQFAPNNLSIMYSVVWNVHATYTLPVYLILYVTYRDRIAR